MAPYQNTLGKRAPIKVALRRASDGYSHEYRWRAPRLSDSVEHPTVRPCGLVLLGCRRHDRTFAEL